MKTFFLAKIALLPFVVFWWLHALGHSTLGLTIGAAIAFTSLLYRLHIRSTYFLEAVAALTMVFLGVSRALNFHFLSTKEVALSFLSLGFSFGVSVILGRPWTMSYSGKTWGNSKENQLFVQINQFISSLWALIFLYLGFSNLIDVLRVATWVPISAGAVISIAFPPFWVRRTLQKAIDSREKYSWTSPFAKKRRALSEENLEADVVVVGAGLGGLTAAALLAQAGLRVIVAEQHYVAGGFCHTWIRKITDGNNRLTFRFDAGVHDISGYWQGGPVHGLLERLGVEQKIEWQRLDHRYHSSHGSNDSSSNSKVVDAPRDWNKFVEQLAQKFPQESAEIQELMAKIKEIYEAMYSEAKFNSGVPSGPKSVSGMLAFNKNYPFAVKWLKQPFMELLRSYIKSPEAQNSFLDLTGYITDNPEKLTVAQMIPLFGYNLHGGHYPIGGSGCLSATLVSAIENCGGRVLLRTPVNKVIIENGIAKGVTLANGQSLRANAVVMNGDFLKATQHLVDPSAFPQEFNSTINQLEPSCSAFLVNLGVRGNFENAKPITHVKTPQGNIGIVIPSLVDPSAAPEGYHSVELIRLLSKDEASSWFSDSTEKDDKAFRASALYKSRKTAMGDEMIRIAEEVLPGLSARIVLRADASPATFRRYAWSTLGAIYGIDLSQIKVGAKSPIPGLVFAGACTHGAGVEAVMISGAEAAEALVPGLLASDFRN